MYTIKTYEICNTSTFAHKNMLTILVDIDGSIGLAGFVPENGKGEALKLEKTSGEWDWKASFGNQSWFFKVEGEIKRGDNLGHDNGKPYEKYIKYEVKNPDQPAGVEGPGSGKGTAGNTGGG